MLIAGLAGSASTYIFIATGVAVGAFGTLAVAIAFWIASNPALGSPTDFPFHIFWHVLSGAFLVAYFYYLRSEQPKTS